MLGWVIQSFADKRTRQVWERTTVRSFGPEAQRAMQRKLLMLDAAVLLEDLRIPPGNRLEPLKGDRKGQHSVRVNRQWRVCFVWTPAGPENVEIVDYH